MHASVQTLAAFISRQPGRQTVTERGSVAKPTTFWKDKTLNDPDIRSCSKNRQKTERQTSAPVFRTGLITHESSCHVLNKKSASGGCTAAPLQSDVTRHENSLNSRSATSN